MRAPPAERQLIDRPTAKLHNLRSMNNPLFDQRFREAHQAFLAGEFGTAVEACHDLRKQSGDSPNLLHLLGMAELKRGNVPAAVQALAKAAELGPANPLVFRDWALAVLSAGDSARAAAILGMGLESHPDQRDLLLALAEIERSRGVDARRHYAKLLAAEPGNRQLIAAAAVAMHEANDRDSAIALLQRAVAADPAWADGLKSLARLRFERGDGEGFTDDFQSALHSRPQDAGLWASFLGVLSSALQFEEVLKQLPDARERAGEQRLFDMFEAQALAECGRLKEAEAAFARLGGVGDPTFVPARLRLLLRCGRFAEAASIGESAVETHAAPLIWPLLALAWRKADEAKWRWLERYDETVGTFDLPFAEGEREELADLLRRLHRGSGRPYDQSARGGTQTLGHLLHRSEPPLRRLREYLSDAVASFIAGLPPVEVGHPFLGRPRNGFEIAGSWSIRLQGEGFHVSHVHPQGWISSACYIALPEIGERDPEQQGWLKLGESPPELGLGLPAVRMVMPKPGRLVLFPSIMWHGTVPFGSGERLSVAFDVVSNPA